MRHVWPDGVILICIRIEATCSTSRLSSGVLLHRTALRVSDFQKVVQKCASCEWLSGQFGPIGAGRVKKPQLANGRYSRGPKNRLTRRLLLHRVFQIAHTKVTSAQIRKGGTSADQPGRRPRGSQARLRARGPRSRRIRRHISCSPHRPLTCAFRFQ